MVFAVVESLFVTSLLSRCFFCDLLLRMLSGSGAAADGRTLLKLGAQLDSASSYAVPRTGRTESPRH